MTRASLTLLLVLQLLSAGLAQQPTRIEPTVRPESNIRRLEREREQERERERQRQQQHAPRNQSQQSPDS